MLALLVAAGLLGLIFGPVLGQLDTRFLGWEDVDHYGTQWFYWFVGRPRSGDGFGNTNLFFYPFGKDIYAHTGANVLDAIVAQPFLWALGQVGGYNAFCVFALLCNGVASYRLMALFAEDRASRIFGATIYALNPFLLNELQEGRPTQVFQPFLPLFFLHIFQLEEDRWRHALWAGVHLALTAFTYWFYAIFAGMVAIVHFAQRAVLHPEPRRFFARHALAGLVSLLFVVPAALPLMASTVDGQAAGLLPEPTWPFLSLSDVTQEGVRIDLYLFQPWLRSNGFLRTADDGRWLFVPNAIVLTWAQLALTALGLALSRHRTVLGAMLLAAGALAVGHLIYLDGTLIPNPLYVFAVRVVPFMRRLWWPARAMVMVGLLVGVISAAGLGEVVRRWGSRAGFALGLLAMLAFGAELRATGFSPFDTWDAAIPKGYRCLKEGPPGALIELPYADTQAHLYYQTYHSRPILGGMIEDNLIFTPKEQRELREQNSFLRMLMALGRDASQPTDYDPQDRQAIYELGYRYVAVAHYPYLKNAPVSRLIDVGLAEQAGSLMRKLIPLLGRPVYVDPDVSIFAPWGDPSPCGEPGPGRMKGEMRRPIPQPSAGETVVFRAKD